VSRQGVLFGQDDRSRLRWRVLLTITEANRTGVHPTIGQIVARVNAGLASPPSDAEVLEATNWLQAADASRGHTSVAL